MKTKGGSQRRWVVDFRFYNKYNKRVRIVIMPLKEINLDKVTYFDLNNQVNIPKNNQIQLEKDQEALDAFLRENVWPNVLKFDSLSERFEWLFENNFLERAFIEQYRLAFIEELYAYLEG